MDRTKAAQLIKDIREAFHDVARGEGITLNEGRAMDDYRPVEDQKEARELDTDIHWWGIPQQKIEKLYDAFTFLDIEGMRYYLAPFLIYALENPESNWPVTDWAVGDLARADRIPEFSIFDATQSVVIARYLQALSLDWEHDEMLAKTAVAALRKYWRQFLPKAAGEE